MTIGMLIESMGGKAAAMHGLFQDSTPFQFHEQQRVIDYVGEQLRSSGFSYYGSEPLYNGQTGNPMKAEIFMGLVFYQRLRHMVSDKYQVRSTGPVMAVTRQPVKGRKKHGGIRLGEMERDSLLSHGVAFCLHDRLMNCSDAHVAQVCGLCGSLLAVRARRQPVERDISGAISTKFRQETVCTNCESTRGVRPVYLPYVYRYLANELAAMGIKLNMTLGER
jgi:DNA-directed RNA polymerase I subunit RPA2